jgi:hypothetical protein
MTTEPGMESLQATLADEHASVFLFGLMGARVSERKHPALFGLLTESFETHRRNRDDLSVAINSQGETPVASAVAYEVPGRVDTPAQIQRVAARLEKRMTLRYGELVENTTKENRSWAIGALQHSALRELAYGLRPRDLPGM